MSHLLDTTICIPLLNGLSGLIRSRYNEVLLEGGHIFMPSIVLFELWYGVSRSAYPFANGQRLNDFLSQQTVVLPFSASDAQAAGVIRHTLEEQKIGMGPMDTLIAGQGPGARLDVGHLQCARVFTPGTL